MGLNDTVISKLKEIREEKQMNIQQFAELLNMERTTYGKIEKGQRDLNLSTIDHFAERLNVLPSYLMGTQQITIGASHYEASTLCVHGVNTTLSINLPNDAIQFLLDKFGSAKKDKE